MYRLVIKPILFMFSPDFVHQVVARLGRIIQSIPPCRWLLSRLWSYRHTTLKQELLGISFANPVGLSAGFDKNIELIPLMSAVGFGFETGGSVTLGPRKGNPRPWFYRLPNTKSIVVHAGLANKGLSNISKRVVRHQGKAQGMPLFISVAVVASSSKETIQDAIIDARNTVKYIIKHDLARAIEINISCPNAGDCQPFSEPGNLKELLAELDSIKIDRPVFIKMPNLPSLSQFDVLLKVIDRHNIHGLTIANLIKDRKSFELKDALPDSVPGGLSGTPARARSTALIRRAYEQYGGRFVIIGVGGIFTAEHAYEKIRAGASLVAMVTGVIYEGPQVVGRINRGLVELMRQDGLANIEEAVGVDVKNRSRVDKKALQ